jgi:hypothetical protein
MDSNSIAKMIELLPDHCYPNVVNYIESLLKQESQTPTNGKTFTFDWEGSISPLSETYTSVELQHKAMDWR